MFSARELIAVAHIDGLLQIGAGDGGVVLLILHQQAVKQVDVADKFAHQPTGRSLVDIHRAADLLDCNRGA